MEKQDLFTILGMFSALLTMAVCILFIGIGLFGGKVSIQIGKFKKDIP
jgi:hypothetical protein